MKLLLQGSIPLAYAAGIGSSLRKADLNNTAPPAHILKAQRLSPSCATQGLRRYASENTELTSKIALKALFDLDEEARKRATGQRRF